MGLLKKIIDALRGGAREIGESIVDANGIRIFEQEISDAAHSLEQAKKDLASVIAKQMQANRKISSLKDDITKHEGYAQQALDQNNETLALEIAQKISDMQSEMAIQSEAESRFGQHVTRLKDMIKKTEVGLADMQRQLTMVKTTDSVQKATQSISNSYADSGSKLLSAKESLDRIESRQQDLNDRMIAGEALNDEFNGNNLEEKLKEAGIGENANKAQDILNELKSRKA